MNSKPCNSFQPQLWRKTVCKECFCKVEAHLKNTKEEEKMEEPMEEDLNNVLVGLELTSSDALNITSMQFSPEIQNEENPVDIKNLISIFSSSSEEKKTEIKKAPLKKWEISKKSPPMLKRSTEEWPKSSHAKKEKKTRDSQPSEELSLLEQMQEDLQQEEEEEEEVSSNEEGGQSKISTGRESKLVTSFFQKEATIRKRPIKQELIRANPEITREIRQVLRWIKESEDGRTRELKVQVHEIVVP